MKILRYILIIAPLLLGACSGGNDNEGEPTGVIPEPYLDAMDKAENVNDVLEDAEQARREQMEQEEI